MNKFAIILLLLFFSFSQALLAQKYSLTKKWEKSTHSLSVIGDIDKDGIVELLDNSSNDSSSVIINGNTGLVKYNTGKNGYLQPIVKLQSKDYDYNNNGIIDFFTSKNIIIDPSTKEILFDFNTLGYKYIFIYGPYDFDNDKTLDFLIYDRLNDKYALFSSNFVLTSIISKDSNIPFEYTLEQNYPNPFNPITTIEYFLQNNGNAKIEIFDTLGKLITVIDEGFKTSGNHKVSFDGNAMKLASGVYYYRLVYEGNADTKKMILLK